ncbi:MAG: HAD family hydrolase [Vicinamibacterales bacterium]
MSRPAVFLDRDGTMIDDVGYLDRMEDVRWFPWTIDAVRLLNRAGYLVCVVTNQGGIGLGLFDEAFVTTLHASLDATLRESGAVVDGWFLCPHHPNAVVPGLQTPCACRKPGRGMIDAACARWDIDLARSWVVGDRDVDVLMADAVGARGVLVRTGYGERESRLNAGAFPAGTPVVMNLMAATALILSEGDSRA